MAEAKKKTTSTEEVKEEAPKAKKASTKASAPKKAASKKAPKKEAVEEVKAEEVKEEAPKAKKASAKKAKAAKEEKKVVEAPKKVVTEAHAKALSVKCTPRKARLVIDLVRGKDVEEALELLATVNHKACGAVSKVIKSAAANAVNNFGLDGDKLYVSSIQASDSIKMRRYLPRAKGSASGLVKRFCNIYVTVKERN